MAQSFFKFILGLSLLQLIAGPCFAYRWPAGFGFREPASINRAALAMVAPSNLLYGHDGQSISPELLVVFHQWKSEQKPFNTAEVLPMDMKPSDNSGAVFSRIADRSVSYWFNRPDFRASPLGRTATEVEENVQQEVILSQSAETQHKLNFSVEAFQATAKIQYSGFTHMALRYQAVDSALGVEMTEALTSNSDLVIGHKDRLSERVSEISLHYSF